MCLIRTTLTVIIITLNLCTVQPEASLPNKTTSHVEGKGDRHSKQFYPLNNFPTIDYQTFLINYLYGSGNPAFPRLGHGGWTPNPKPRLVCHVVKHGDLGACYSDRDCATSPLGNNCDVLRGNCYYNLDQQILRGQNSQTTRGFFPFGGRKKGLGEQCVRNDECQEGLVCYTRGVCGDYVFRGYG
ncbi:uncharacterized protein LOC110846157 [Folsomia candida]|uniref:Uncharacterized protein n=1 Tax=Folsomia candida TaxID=158441 RepID=A0A226EJU7_FOLCA|nr:uncharacterized protein LOC110846157 [Folsomia candida]OXA57478.1 hypothetical protein Fcan01_06503 [Folsomia candida]